MYLFYIKIPLALVSALLFAGCAPQSHDDINVLIVVGPSTNPPGSHEVEAGGRLIEYCLENNENGIAVQANVIYAWNEIPHDIATYDTFVFIGDKFPGERLPESDRAMEELAVVMAKGRGIVCLHYGVGLLDEDVARDGDHPLLHWMGGYFATRCEHHQSTAKIYEAARIEAANPNHPTANGWDAMVLHDEPYTNNYFGPDDNQLLPGAFAVATSMLPPNQPKEEIIAWGIERADTGRGIGVTLPHFYKNWQVDPLRTFIFNSILWSAKFPIPEDGIRTTLPDLETFNPVSVDFIPRRKREN